MQLLYLANQLKRSASKPFWQRHHWPIDLLPLRPNPVSEIRGSNLLLS